MDEGEGRNLGVAADDRILGEEGSPELGVRESWVQLGS